MIIAICSIALFGALLLLAHSTCSIIRLNQYTAAKDQYKPAYDAAFKAAQNAARFDWSKYPNVGFTEAMQILDDKRQLSEWHDKALDAYFVILRKDKSALSAFAIFRPIYTEEEIKTFSTPPVFDGESWPEQVDAEASS